MNIGYQIRETGFELDGKLLFYPHLPINILWNNKMIYSPPIR